MTARRAPARGRVFCWAIGRRTSTTPGPSRSAVLARQFLKVSLRPRLVRRGAGKADIAVGADKAEVPGIGPPGCCLHQLREFRRQRRDGIGRADSRDLSLVRPDSYVGFAGAASDRAGAEAYLQNLAR